MTIDEEKLMAYADGELSAAERAEIEQALAADDGLRARLEAHQRLGTRLAGAFDGALAEPVPARLAEALKPKAAEVVTLADRRAARPKWSAREWGAMAASIAAGLFIGVGVMNTQSPLIAATDSGLVARGELARALDTQLASDQSGAVRIGLTFRAESGEYCRTFDLTERATSGLACRVEENWNVAMTSAHASGGEVRMAGAAPEILAAVDAMIAGEPLDAESEQQARDRDWHPN
jgi:hypothetical protein